MSVALLRPHRQYTVLQWGHGDLALDPCLICNIRTKGAYRPGNGSTNRPHRRFQCENRNQQTQHLPKTKPKRQIPTTTNRQPEPNPINTSDKGAWTRVNRKNPKERSIIDYALISKSLANNITETTTDEEETHRIRGRNETDHKHYNGKYQYAYMHKAQSTTIKRWKLDNNEGWKQYNKKKGKKWLRWKTQPTKHYRRKW